MMRQSRLLLHAMLAASMLPLAACGGGGHGSLAAPAGAAAIPLLSTPEPVQAAVLPSPASSQVLPSAPILTPPGSNSFAAAVPAASTAIDTTPVQVHLSFKLSDGIASVRNPVARVRRRQFISPSNTLIGITVTPFGGSGTVYGPSACTSGACAISFTATPGANTLAFTLVDGSANVLSRFSTTTIVQPSTINTLKFSANPVVNSVSLSLLSPTSIAGTPGTDLLTVNALDAAGNTIVGNDRYVDGNGEPLALTFSVSNAQAGGRGNVSLIGPPRVTSPGQAAIYASYNGAWMDSAVISVSTTRPIAGSLGSTTLTTVPHAYEYAVTGGSSPFSIVKGPDGNLWFTELGRDSIGKISPSGMNYVEYPCTPCDGPHNITVGPDGNLWYTEYFSNYIGTMNTSGTPAHVVATAIQPAGITLGPDGSLWYCTQFGQRIGRIFPNKTSTVYVGSNMNTRNGGFGPDGVFWYLNVSADKLERMDQRGRVISSVSIGAATAGIGDGMVLGPDGNMWFTVFGADIVAKVTPAGLITPYALPTGAGPINSIVGPDGAIWFTENGTTSNIGRITTAGALTRYGTTFGISTAAAPRGITVGPDGNIWFTVGTGDRVVKFVY